MTTESTSAKPCMVLLVEDNLADAELATLRAYRNSVDMSFQVEHVEELASALARLAEGGIDVALVDLVAPRLQRDGDISSNPRGRSDRPDCRVDRLGR